MATRSEHRRQTLRQISDAAIDLFEAHGSSATVEDVARLAGVSRRTVFRYIDRKEDLAYLHPVLWFDVFDDALRPLRDRALLDRLRLASQAIAEHIDADPEPPRRAFRVAGANPALSTGFTSVFARWVDRIALETLRDTPDPKAIDRFHARIVGSAVMGMVDAVTREWVLSAPQTSFVELYDQGFAVLAPIIAPD